MQCDANLHMYITEGAITMFQGCYSSQCYWYSARVCAEIPREHKKKNNSHMTNDVTTTRTSHTVRRDVDGGLK